jgi:hypothetical protein
MSEVQIDSIEIDMQGQGRTEIEHSPEVLAALQSAAALVAARAAALSVSGEAEYHHGVDIQPTTAHGYVVTANIQARAANGRPGMNPLKVAIGG